MAKSNIPYVVARQFNVARPKGCVIREEDIARRMNRLTVTRKTILFLMTLGLLNKQIAEICGITEATVKAHVSHIMERVGLFRRTALAVQFALLLERGQVAYEWPAGDLSDGRPLKVQLPGEGRHQPFN